MERNLANEKKVDFSQWSVDGFFSILHDMGENIVLKCPFIVMLSFVWLNMLVNNFSGKFHISNCVNFITSWF